MRHRLLAAALIASLALPALADADARMLAAARAAEPALIASLEDMVAIESGSRDADGIARMADYVERRLQALGAQLERLPPASGKGAIVKGSFAGSGSARLMLIAHMDTVYPRGTLAAQPWRIDGNRAYGPGIADDKSGIAVILHALAMLKDAGWRDAAVVTVLFNADEELGSPGSGEWIERLADEHDVVLSYEPCGAKAGVRAESVLLSTAGVASVRMEVSGRAAHAGVAPKQGRNALLELAHQLLQTEDIAKDIPGAQLNWTYAQAGIVRNQIPEQAVASADVRLLHADSADKLLAALQARVAQSRHVPDTEVRVSLAVGRAPLLARPAGEALARRAQAIYAELDGRPLALLHGAASSTDAGHAGRSGKAAVLEGLGLAGAGYHARDEYIEIDSIAPRLYLTTRLLMDLARR